MGHVFFWSTRLAGSVTHTSKPSPGGFQVPTLPFSIVHPKTEGLSTQTVFGAHVASPGQLKVFDNRITPTSAPSVSPSTRSVSASSHMSVDDTPSLRLPNIHQKRAAKAKAAAAAAAAAEPPS